MPRTKGLFNRRQFLKAGAAGLGSLAAAAVPRSAQAAPPQMPTRPFGKSGREVSILGLGTMFDVTANQIVLRQALALGVTYWDTADCYSGGNSELGFGQFFARYPKTRNKVFLVTKSDSTRPDGMTRLLERSLERMQTSYIDLYFLHGISSIDECSPAVRRWADAAKASGKIKLFGFSTHRNMESCLMGAASLGWIDGIMMTYNYRLMHTPEMRRAAKACHQAGIGLTAMKTLGGGPMTSHDDVDLKLAGRFIERGFTPAQAKLKAVWESPYIASLCSQMPTVALVRENAAAAMDRARLAAGDRRLLDAYAQATACTYCAGCAALCEGAMGGRVPVAEVMRYLMYRQSYAEPGLAEERFPLPPADPALLAGMDFDPAERACPQGLPVTQLMRRAAAMLA